VLWDFFFFSATALTTISLGILADSCMVGLGNQMVEVQILLGHGT
jgi:hypothetical protein